MSQRVLPWVVSDHCPHLVLVGSVNKGRSAFKFENMWLKEEGFVEMVQQWWNGYCFSGSLSFILARKLKTLKDDLKKWNKEEFWDLTFRKKCLLFELLGLDAREDLLGLSQKDQTRFFYRVANSHRRINHFRGIEVDGVLYQDEEEDQDELQSKVVHFYRVCTLSQIIGAHLWMV